MIKMLRVFLKMRPKYGDYSFWPVKSPVDRCFKGVLCERLTR